MLIWNTICCPTSTGPGSERTASRNLEVDVKRRVWARWSDSVVPAVGGHAEIPKTKRSLQKGLGIRLKYLGLLVLILCVAIGQATTTGFCEESKRWSFVFKDTPLSDAVDELRRTTGIDIVSNQLPSDRVVTKRYIDESIDEIIKDLFKGLSFALVWNKGEDGKDTVDVWILDSKAGQSASLPKINRPEPRTPALGFKRKPPVSPRPHEDTETEEPEEPEEDVEESSSQPAEPDEEGEKEDAGSNGDLDTRSPEDAGNQAPDESDEEAAEAGTSSLPVKTPGFE